MIHLTESESKQFLIKKPNSFDAFPSEEKRLENTQQMRQSCLILLLNTFHSQIKSVLSPHWK